MVMHSHSCSGAVVHRWWNTACFYFSPIPGQVMRKSWHKYGLTSCFRVFLYIFIGKCRSGNKVCVCVPAVTVNQANAQLYKCLKKAYAYFCRAQSYSRIYTLLQIWPQGSQSTSPRSIQSMKQLIRPSTLSCKSSQPIPKCFFSWQSFHSRVGLKHLIMIISAFTTY